MTESSKNQQAGAAEMDDVGRLIKLAGARETIEEERFDRVRLNVHQHWQEVVSSSQAKSRPRRLEAIAMVASLAVIVGIIFTLSEVMILPEVRSLADVQRVLGEVKIAGELAAGDSFISADSSINTGSDGRVALRLSGGQLLRIDSASQVRLHSPGEISLDRGAIYIDTTFASVYDPIRVTTPLGTARDIGTRFQVRLTGMAMIVGVRDGLVELSQASQAVVPVDKGSSVELDANGGVVTKPLDTNDPGWDWIDKVAPPFDIQGATLEQYLNWYAHERSLELIWADETSERNANQAFLAGSIEDLSLDQGLDLVQQIAPFEYRLAADQFKVTVK